MPARLPKIAITMGDPNGIGPEVVVKALASQQVAGKFEPVVVGVHSVLSHYAERMSSKLELQHIRLGELSESSEGLRGEVKLIEPPGVEDFTSTLGACDAEAGRLAGASIELATELAVAGRVDAIVTGPVSKGALNLAGYSYPGQTEFIAKLTAAEEYLMLMVARDLRVGLATTHLPLDAVSATLSTDLLVKKLRVLDDTLKRRFRIEAPVIGVCGLNPHCGDGGLFGSEEGEIIQPAVERAQNEGIDARGPLPSDTLFVRSVEKGYHAILAMYHDQGMIPFKMNAFGKGVNYSAGLPVIRTSPDHGTAFDIAGGMVADPASMCEAIQLALKLKR